MSSITTTEESLQGGAVKSLSHDKTSPSPLELYGLPYWGNENGQKMPPLELFEHYEHGKDADPEFGSLLKEGVKISDITKSIGAEVTGVQLSQLDNKAKDELALLVAQKKVVVFHDQDFNTIPIQQAVDFASYFGKLHVHPVSGAVPGFPQLHMVHRGLDDVGHDKFLETRTTSVSWHSDVSYELQPPGTTFLFAIDVPEAGGDTLFVNQVKAYERLSPAFRQRLEGLKVVHSAHEQARAALENGGQLRREPITSVHPLVRTHPATGEKALYIQPQFARSIVGYKKEESDALLNFLYHHIAFSQDLQCRVKWNPRSVVVWDNRVTAHSGLVDWEGPRFRYIARLAAQAEVPTE
ncbi:TauD domain-containing protein [Fusarium keratoplasticum]|uniref:TauD domain-containing protein n=1 Tax=Fusarium keratoplasticum TaxID=1328300 RepID=A0ACC0QIE1_9HYPO|nr:TauD domain-containing protein [Fusarium keratoplasticum]KAI8652578.1 TauD domain-containing protein [Fusarium keratoplasticum]KAI8653302.1 TauD domain-containing protein [Fusarium keratoplasticum]